MVGTFHSIGSKFLGWHASRRGDDENNDFLTERMIEEFCGKFGIQKFASSSFRTDYDDPEGTDEFSQIVSAYDMARNRMDGSSATDYFDSKKFDTDYLVEQLEKLKEQSGKHDYTDILVASLDVDFSPIDFLIIDEAQDLTPLMWAIVRRIRQYASKVVLAGDDMQSIYSFRGASPIDFLLQRKDAKVFHLSKSYRLPSEVKNFSDQISSRVAITEDVKFESNGKKGAVYQWSLEDFLTLRGEKWILCRTGFVAEKVNRLLIMYDIPFLPLNIRHRGFSPWTREDISLVNALHAWPNLNARQVEEVIKLLPGNVLIRGVKTRRGNRWYSSTIRNVLTYHVYSGTAYYNRRESSEPVKRRNPHKYPRQLKTHHFLRPKDQWIMIPVPAIISEEHQISARKKLSSNKLNSPRKTKYLYLLRRLVVCGECGRKMNCVSVKAKGRDLRYPYYACRSKEWVPYDQQCRARRVRADWLDDSVWNSIRTWLQKPDVLRAEFNSVLSMAEAGESFSKQWNDLASLIRSYEKQISRVEDAYQAGAMDLRDLKERKEALSAKISDSKTRQEALTSMRQKQIDVERILADIDAFSETIRNGLGTLDFSERRSVVELLVERVIVKGEEVTIENVVPLNGRFSVLNTDGGDIFIRPQEVMGEIIRARRTDYMIQKVGLKVLYYDIMKKNTRTSG